MKRLVQMFALMAALLVPWVTGAQITLPYSCDFEDATENSAWTLVNGTLTNVWVIDTAVNNTEGGNTALYISNNSGTSAAYTVTNATVVYAYFEVYLEAGEYAVSYDWKCVGEGTTTPYDYILAAVVDNSVTLTASTALPTGVSYSGMTAAGWINIGNTGTRIQLHQSANWTTQTSTFTITTAGTYRIVFVWRNDSSGSFPAPSRWLCL